MKHSFKLLIAATILFTSCSKQDLTKTKNSTATTDVLTKDMISENGGNLDEAGLGGADLKNSFNAKIGVTGHVYTESNAAGKNAIISYDQKWDGTLTWAGSTWSGGNGAGVGLGSQGALALSKDKKWLFAVNAGSNNVSSFAINSDGSLKLAHTSTSGGKMPISLTVFNNLLYVVNSASSSIYGLRIGWDGSLTSIPGSYRRLSDSMAGPAEIAFSPDGSSVFVTEKSTNKISAFAILPLGGAKAVTVNASVGNTPFGFDFAKGKYMIVTNADGGKVGTSSVTSYDDLFLHPMAVNGAVPNYQSAVCWVAVVKYGSFAFTANTGSKNITSYYISPAGKLYLIPWASAPTGAGPADIIVSANNTYVYCISGGSHYISEFKRGLVGNLYSIGTSTGLPDFAAGLVAL